MNREATALVNACGARAGIVLLPDMGTLKFVGESSRMFANECGITVRREVPMNHHAWRDIPGEVHTRLRTWLAVSIFLRS